MFPTPTSRDHKDGTAKSCENVPVNGLLGRMVHMLPTPTAERWDGLQSHGKNVVSGSLNPTWVEWLQGFPLQWTEVSNDEMGRTEESTENCSKPSGNDLSDTRLQCDGELGTASPELLGSEPLRDSLPVVPCESGHSRRLPTPEKDKELQSMREGIHPEPHQEAHDLQQGMSIGDRTDERSEAVEYWDSEPPDIPRIATGVKNRVDRLRGLGNSVVPQCAEFIGRMILQTL
jgi:hypothetical protein